MNEGTKPGAGARAERREPAEEEKESPPSEFEGDPITQRLIVMFLGIALILVILFVFLIRLDGGDIPDSLIALGSSAIGALAGFLTGTRGATSKGREPRESGLRDRAARLIRGR